jgi:hypothetical protein
MVDEDVEALLRRSGRNPKTRSQRAMEDAFGAPKGSTPASRTSLARKRSKRW